MLKATESPTPLGAKDANCPAHVALAKSRNQAHQGPFRPPPPPLFLQSHDHKQVICKVTDFTPAKQSAYALSAALSQPKTNQLHRPEMGGQSQKRGRMRKHRRSNGKNKRAKPNPQYPPSPPSMATFRR